MKTPALAVAALALSVTGCTQTTPKVVPDVRGDRLDVAERVLDARGLQYETVGGGVLGVVVLSHWTVCSQSPRPGRHARSVVLYVDRIDDDSPED